MAKINIIEMELSSLCNAKCSACMRTMLDQFNKPYYKGNLQITEIQEWFDSLDLRQTKIKMYFILRLSFFTSRFQQTGGQREPMGGDGRCQTSWTGLVCVCWNICV